MSDPLAIAAIHPPDLTASAASVAGVVGVAGVANGGLHPTAAAVAVASEQASIVALSDGAQLLSAVAILQHDPVQAESAPPAPLIATATAATPPAVSVQAQAAVAQANLALQHQLVDEAFSGLFPHPGPAPATQTTLAANASPPPGVPPSLPAAFNTSYLLNPPPLYANDPGVAAVVAAYHLNERIFTTPLDALHERLPPVQDKVHPVAETTAVAPVGAIGSEQEQGGKHHPGNEAANELATEAATEHGDTPT
jgi:hypothetical protein